MKTIWITLIALAVLISGSRPVQAGNECWAAVGGFLGGVIFSSAARTSCAPPPPVYYCPPPVVTRRVIIEEPVEVGHYEYRERQVWVPGCWVYEQTRCGDLIRTWRPGYYECVQVRVWVPGCRSRRHACDW